jgi:hypothetical protein
VVNDVAVIPEARVGVRNVDRTLLRHWRPYSHVSRRHTVFDEIRKSGKFITFVAQKNVLLAH